MNKKLLVNVILASLMVLSAYIAVAYKPTQKVADLSGKVDLDLIIPDSFSNWTRIKDSGASIINPQQEQVLNQIYTQTLSRTYVNAQGDFIMISIAYGDEQSDTNQVHIPDVCYPAQGFQLVSSKRDIVRTGQGEIRVKRLFTKLGSRSEPLTYWTTVGDKVVSGGFETKMTQLKYGLNGLIADGLIFRVSSINSNAEESYALQNRFIDDLLTSLPATDRHKLAGI
ncbi:exosortase-associated protein EpsI, B-type [Methylobacillus sp. Pita1]|uniref:exosortase-associated protein EpsI, B-type n=1 Tax=Methylobacillus sp. Pita1 TaxID=3382642 RepID=UPI0038B43889